MSFFSRNSTPAAAPRAAVTEPSFRSLLSDKDTFKRELLNYQKDGKSYQEVLTKFLSDYKAMRNSHAKEYYFFNLGCPKTIKVSATNKLIARLTDNPAEAFTPEEIHALNDGNLKKTIATT